VIGFSGSYEKQERCCWKGSLQLSFNSSVGSISAVMNGRAQPAMLFPVYRKYNLVLKVIRDTIYQDSIPGVTRSYKISVIVKGLGVLRESNCTE